MNLARRDIVARLSDPRALARATPTMSDDAEAAAASRGGLIAAAVLVPIIWHPAGPGVLLTLRSARLSSHAGQVAFPGGRMEAGETPEQAALREAAEEVGLDPRRATLIGSLPEHLTGTGYRVTPVVAFIEPPISFIADPNEVAAMFELPLATVLDPLAPERRRAEHRGRMREFWAWPHEEHLIWGATASILVNLARVLRE